MLTEQDVLTGMVLAGCSVLYIKQVQRVLATLSPDQRALMVAVYALPLGHGACPYLLPPDTPVEVLP